MTPVLIQSVDDPRIAVYRNLPSRSAGQRESTFIAEGLILTERLLASGLQVTSVLAEQRFVDRLRPLTPADVPVYVAPGFMVREISGFKFHRGVLACAVRPSEAALERLIPATDGSATITVCAGIADLENLGAIVRCSAAFGSRGVVVGPNCCDPFARRVGRTSMGANFVLPIRESRDLRADLVALRDHHAVQLIATVLDEQAETLRRATRDGPVALLFGGEGYGLDREWIDLCHRRVTIPMARGTDSLNVGVAAGICLHHFTR
jgi:tRNA G18 (ribose-2'-O)-methylase SpoU